MATVAPVSAPKPPAPELPRSMILPGRLIIARRGLGCQYDAGSHRDLAWCRAGLPHPGYERLGARQLCTWRWDATHLAYKRQRRVHREPDRYWGGCAKL